MTKTKLALAFAVIFLVGAAAGAAGGVGFAWHRLHHPPSAEQMAARMGAKLQSRLQLSPQQAERIRPILLRNGAQMDAIHHDTFQRVRQVIDDSAAQIAAELTPEQQPAFEQMKRERLEHVRGLSQLP